MRQNGKCHVLERDRCAVEQLQIWADRAGVSIVKQEMGSDPASVAYDTVSSAVAKGADVVLIDTAGRLHNRVNLMNELNQERDTQGDSGCSA